MATSAVMTVRSTAQLRFCACCGGALELLIPAGDHTPRHVCRACGHIHYVNPRMVVGCICEADQGRILMCRRAINPRRGFWTFPSGFLECGESGPEGASREAREEAQAHVEIADLLCVIDVPQISEVHLVYRARLLSVQMTPTYESDEIALLDQSEIPWDRLAFTSIEFSLRSYFEDRTQGEARVYLTDLR